MTVIETIKHEYPDGMDLTFTSFNIAIVRFYDLFSITPQNLVCSIESFPTILCMENRLKEENIFPGMDRNLPKFSWLLSKFEKGKEYILYFKGA